MYTSNEAFPTPRRSVTPYLRSGLLAALFLALPLVQAADIYQVKADTSGASVIIGGTVVPRQEVNLAAQLPGRVASLAGKEGDRFEAGSVLVSLDDTELQAQKAAALAAIDSADATVRDARMQYRRELVNPQGSRASAMPGMAMPGMMDQVMSRPMASMMGMEAPGVQRQTDLHQRGTQIRQATSGVGQAQAGLKQIEAKIRDSRSLAPFDGVITAKRVEVGDTVQPGQPLLSFADLDRLQVKSDVPARLSRVLRAGQVIQARLDSGQSVTTIVDQVFPVADAQRHTVVVKLNMPKGVDAAPGMYADVLIPDPDNKGPARPVIPRSALIWRGSLPGVMRLDANDRPQLKLIRISDVGMPDTVQVFAGLKVGDRILANPD